MALKIVQSVQVEISPVTKPVVEPQKVFVVIPDVTEVEAMTAEYIELYRKYEYFEVKALVKRMDEIRKQLVGIANETMEASDPAVFTSAQGKIIFSERSKTAKVAHPLALVQELLEKFGPEATASVVDIAMTPLRKLLSDFELKAHLTEQPGGRILKGVIPA